MIITTFLNQSNKRSLKMSLKVVTYARTIYQPNLIFRLIITYEKDKK